jgi:ABC-2 type transport system permease protein
MRKTLLIFIQEVYVTVRQPLFWVSALFMPGLILLFTVGSGWRDSIPLPVEPSPILSEEEIKDLISPEVDTHPKGYVDQSGLLDGAFDDADSQQLIGYADEEQARADLTNGIISALYVIPADYLETMQITVYTLKYEALIDHSQYRRINGVLTSRLLEGQIEDDQIETVFDPLAGLQEINLTPASEVVRDPDNFMTMLLPYGVMSFFTLSVLGTASLLFSSLSKEKENRILEILMNSATAHQVLLGKISAVGLIGLAQVLIYGATGLVSLRWSGEQSILPKEYVLEPSILIWGVAFFVSGYLLYAAIVAAMGVLVTNLRETSQASTLLMLPAMLPYFLIPALLNDPNGGIAVGFSLFPLTAPGVMLLRISSAVVPLWQILLSLALLTLSALLVVRLAARLFRAQNLLSGQSFQLKRILRAVFFQR